MQSKRRQYDPLLYTALAGLTAAEAGPIFSALNLIEDRLAAAGVLGSVRIQVAPSQSDRSTGSTPSDLLVDRRPEGLPLKQFIASS